jgi:hypothetical protein
MRIALVTATCVASLAAVCAAAAMDHQAAPKAAVKAAPSAKPAAKPVAAKAGPHCVVVRRHAARHEHRGAKARRASATRRHWSHGRGPEDFGVAPSQAYAYRQEFERDHRGFGGYPPPPPGAGPGPGLRSYSFERREGHGFVERDGRRFDWSWGPCSHTCPAPHPGDGGHWRNDQGGGYEVYRSRDANGYLTWPGKPR